MPENSTDSEAVSTLFTNSEGSFVQAHDAILQRLDTWQPFPDTSLIPGGMAFYAPANFTQTEPAWDSVPALFIPPGTPVRHPNPVALANDLEGEAARIGATVIQNAFRNTHVITEGPGEPRMVTEAHLGDHPLAESLAAAGKLALSTGFTVPVTPNGMMVGKVRPNHVLLFRRGDGQPNDKGAMFANTTDTVEVQTMEDSETKGILTKILDALTVKATVENAVVDPKLAEMEAQIATLTKERDALAVKATEFANLQAEQEKVAKDAEWAQVKNLHQPGLFHKEKEAVERAAYEAAPAKWLMAHVGNLQTVKAAPAKGEAAVGNLGEDEGAPFDMVSARGKLNPVTGRYE